MPTVRPFGASVKRVEDPKYLLGRAQYVDDVKLPGAASVAFVRSQHAHALIKGIDVRKALKIPGVLRVMTGEEARSEEHTSELQSQSNLVCRLLLEKKK